MLGCMMTTAMIACGMILTYINDIRNNKEWNENAITGNRIIAATLSEPLVVKEKSYKANAAITDVIEGDTMLPFAGNIIIYLRKDSNNARLSVGDQLLFTKPLQEIKNTGNPAGFDYKQYALFNGITHQIYLTNNDYVKLNQRNISNWASALFATREYVLSTIKTNIKGKKEQGLAEAMLIGYKNDLDKTLLQSYTNTGVVHVIAVSGMHLAMLYWMVNLLLSPLLKKKLTKWMHPVLVLLILWGFSFLTGGAASIVRAAVMFSFITIGKQINRNTSIYNTLALSAFCLLCYNPYWLWDVGFQLSYMAVLSIVVFYKFIYNLLYIENKLLNNLWQLAAVSIAAQILTTPLALYYFHQFPTYFLLANMVVVPVSTIVLIGTILLVIVSPIKIIAGFIGYVLNAVIWWLNSFIEMVEDFPLAQWGGLQINFLQAVLLFVFIAAISFFIIEKYKQGVWVALCSVLLFFTIRSYSFYKAMNQQRIIVYNANKLSAIDFILGRQYIFEGGESLLKDPLTYSFAIKPSHTLNRIKEAEKIHGYYKKDRAILFQNKKILCVNSALVKVSGSPIHLDLIILSGNPKLYISQIKAVTKTSQIVIDGSVPAWKARYWIRDCDSLHIPCHNVATDGAFVMNLH